MDQHVNNESLLSRYLLGQLTDAEQGEIEERFLRDDEHYQKLLLVEDELRCAYAKGLLAPAERELFERRFLIFPDEQQRVELVSAVIEELSGINVEETPRQEARDEGRSWPKRLPGILNFGNPRLAFAMTTVALLAVAAFAWLAVQTARLRQHIAQLESRQAEQVREIQKSSEEERSRLESLNKELAKERSDRALIEQELARHPDAPPVDREAPSPVLSLILVPGRLRGEGTANKLTVPQNATQVVLILKVGESGSRRNYRAEILNSEGARVWSRDGLPGGRELVVLRIPARILAEDDYEISLTGLNQAGDSERVGDYYFTILKR